MTIGAILDRCKMIFNEIERSKQLLYFISISLLTAVAAAPASSSLTTSAARASTASTSTTTAAAMALSTRTVISLATTALSIAIAKSAFLSEAIGAALGIHEALIGLDQAGSLLGKLKSEDLERTCVGLADNNSVGGLVPAGVKIAIDHHLRNDRGGLGLVHVEHSAKLTEGKGVILRRISEEVSAKTFELDLLEEHLANLLHDVFARNKAPNFKVRQKTCSLSPVALLHGLGGTHDIIARLFRRSSKHLTVVNVVVFAEGAGNDTVAAPTGIAVTSGGHVGQLEQHGTNEVACLEKIQIDVLMEGYLSSLLGLLLLGRLVAESASRNTLGQKLPDASSTDIGQTVVSFPDLSKSECRKAEDDHHTVEEDLSLDITRHANCLLNVRHEEKITRLVETIVVGMVEDMAEHGSGLGPVGTIVVDVRA